MSHIIQNGRQDPIYPLNQLQSGQKLSKGIPRTMVVILMSQYIMLLNMTKSIGYFGKSKNGFPLFKYQNGGQIGGF